MDLLIIYVFGVLATSSIMLAWFFSYGTTYIIRAIYYTIGYRNEEFKEAVYNDWKLAITIYDNGILSELLTCPICLSFHIGFWVGVASLFLPIDLPIYYPIITLLTYPIISNLLLKLYSSHA